MSRIYQAFQRALLRLSKRFSRAGLYEWLNEVVSSIPSSEKNVVLSVGAGGDVSELIGRRIGARVTEVDIDPARKPDIVADVCDMNMFADQSVDVIFMVEVLEHVKTPQRALDEMHRVLKPGGKLYASTNGMRHLKEIDDLIIGFRGGTRPIASVITMFNLDTGQDVLARHFARVDIDRQANALRIIDPEALTAFCLSITRAAIPEQSHPAFASYVAQHVQAHGGTLHIEKDAGLFVAMKG